MNMPPAADGPDKGSAPVPDEAADTTPDEPPGTGPAVVGPPDGTADGPPDDEPAAPSSEASGSGPGRRVPGTEPSGGEPESAWTPPDTARAEDAGPVEAGPPPPPPGPAPAPPPPGPDPFPTGPPHLGGIPPGALPPGAPASLGPQPPAGPKGTSRLAIAALVTGLLALVPVAIGLGIAALVHLRRRTHKGVGLAIGGIAASVVWVVAAVTVAVITVVSTFTVERDDAGRIIEGGRVQFSALQEGDCYTGFGPDDTVLTLVDAVPCSEPHRGEVMATLIDVTGSTERPGQLCGDRMAYLAKSRHREYLKPYVHVPASGAARDEPKLSCAMHYIGPGTLDTRLDDTVDDDLKEYEHLQVGECIEDMEEVGGDAWVEGIVRTLPCTEPHRYQVYAAFDIPLDDPDTPVYDRIPQEAIEQKAERRCDTKADEMLADAPRIGLELSWVMPPPHPTQTSQSVVCFVGMPGGAKLEESIVSE